MADACRLLECALSTEDQQGAEFVGGGSEVQGGDFGTEIGERRTENGKRRTENGERGTENGKRRLLLRTLLGGWG